MTPTPAVTVFVYYDYFCPFSYLVSKRLDALGRERPLVIHWRPLPLGPEAEKRSDRPDERSAAKGPRLPILAAQFAADVGRSAFRKLHRRIFEALHEEGRDIGLREELLALASESGLDASALERSLDDGRYDSELEIARAEAERYDITATPTLLFGRFKLVGAAPIDELRRAAELAATDV